MKKIKIAKLLCLVLALTMAVTLLAACGGSQPTSSSDTSKASDTAAVSTGAAESTTAAEEEPGWKKDTSPMQLDW